MTRRPPLGFLVAPGRPPAVPCQRAADGDQLLKCRTGERMVALRRACWRVADASRHLPAVHTVPATAY